MDKIDPLEQLSTCTQKAIIGGKLCAVKFFSASNDTETASLAEKIREKFAGSEFSEIFTKKNFVFAVRPFIAGTPFSFSGEISPIEALNQIIEIAKVVEVRVHGNLKPGNIIRNEDGNFEVTDSKARELYFVRYRKFGPDLSYLAPEQICEKTEEKSDVYALGILLGKMLCGKTPFDGKSEDSVIEEKQSGDPDWSMIGENIPERLKDIVRKASRSDMNARHQSVAEFIEDCRKSAKVIAGSTEPVPPPSAQAKSEEKKSIPLNPNKRFVLVGHTGAGKTVLAAGLYSTFSRKKELSVEAADEPTKQLANNFKTVIETNSWPAATTGAAQKLSFRIAHNRDAAELDFDEYMGERVTDVKSYIRDILKTPDGVLLLMNPGGIQFQLEKDKPDTPKELALRRNKLLSDLKSIIDYLFKLKKRPSVALVVTASDRLKTDLKGFAPEFARYVEEIEAALDTRCKTWWKRFDISVCGELSDQDKPRLNPQGIEEPFLWLLSRHAQRERNLFIKKCVARTAGALGVAALVAASWWGVDFYRATLPEKEMRASIAAYSGKNNEADLLGASTALVCIRQKYCTERHITDSGKRVSDCRGTCKPFFLFPDRQRVYEANIKNLEIAIDGSRAKYLGHMLTKALGEASLENCRIADEIAGWIPLQSEITARADSLKETSRKEVPIARERYVFEKCYRKLIEIIDNPIDGNVPKDLVSEVDAFISLSPAKTKEQHDRYSEMLKSKLAEARQKCERYRFACRTKELDIVLKNPEKGLGNLPEAVETLCASETVLPQEERNRLAKDLNNRLHRARNSVFGYGAKKLLAEIKESNPKRIDDWVPVLKKWNAFKAQENSGVEAELVEKYRLELYNLTEDKTLALLSKLFDEHAKKQMQSESFVELKFLAEWKEKVIPINTDFGDKINELLAKREEQLQRDWDMEMKRRIDEFIASNKGRDAKEQLQKFKAFYREHSKNPHIKDAIIAVHNVAFDTLKSSLSRWRNSESEYRGLKELCRAIRAAGVCPTFTSLEIYHFANTYISWLDNYSRIVTVRVYKQRDPNVDDIYIDSISFGWKTITLGYRESYPKEFSISLGKPWEAINFTLEFKDCGYLYDGGLGGTDSSRTFSVNWFGLLKHGQFKSVWDDFSRAYGLDFQASATGSGTIWEIVEEIWSSKPDEK